MPWEKPEMRKGECGISKANKPGTGDEMLAGRIRDIISAFDEAVSIANSKDCDDESRRSYYIGHAVDYALGQLDDLLGADYYRLISLDEVHAIFHRARECVSIDLMWTDYCDGEQLYGRISYLLLKYIGIVRGNNIVTLINGKEAGHGRA